MKRIAIGNDHGGLDTKLMLKEHLQSYGYEIIDFGSNDDQIVRYPYYAGLVAKAVARGDVDGGILICSTGIGMSIVANKYKHVRAALCTSSFMAKMTRLHNDSNVLCLGGKITGPFEILEIVDTWLANEFMGQRHNISLEIIRQTEEALMVEKEWYPPKDIDVVSKGVDV